MKALQTKSTSDKSINPSHFFRKGEMNGFFGQSQQSFFSNPVKSNSSFVQTKLSVGKPNDPYEKEADAVADKVVQRLTIKDSVQAKPIKQTISPLIQTKCADCEKEEKLQKKEEETELEENIQRKQVFENSGIQESFLQKKCAGCEKEEKLQWKEDVKNTIRRKPIFDRMAFPNESKIQRKCTACEKEKKLQTKEQKGAPSPTLSSIETRLSSTKGAGSAIPQNIQTTMGSAIGANFSNVKIHTGQYAVQMSRELNAQAFTLGNDIYFNSGKYDTSSRQGTHLLAHELTHTVQQDKSGSSSALQNIQRLCSSARCLSIDPLTPSCPDSDVFLTDDSLLDVRNSIFISSTRPKFIGWEDTGSGVELIQRLLLNLDCSSPHRTGLHNDLRFGIYGNSTRSAVKDFQSANHDSNGLPLDRDGRVGPATLSAMDVIMGLPPVSPPLAAEGRGNCFGKAIHGPGEFRELNIARGQMPLQKPFFPALQAWEISNFDIDKHFIKTEHRNFLRSTVVPAILAQIRTLPPSRPLRVKIIGEASTTASDTHNQGLSERRALCLFETLVGLGINPGQIVVTTGLGEILARQRRFNQGLPDIDNIEDRTERKVTIAIDVDRAEDSCTTAHKSRSSSRFIGKIACQSPDTYFVNIGDVSDMVNPTYREFIWIHGDVRKGCRYSLDVGPGDHLGMSVAGPLHLATNNPDNFFSNSDFQGSTLLRTIASGSALLTRTSALGPIYNIAIPGKWTDATCLPDVQDVAGAMIPRGPVRCGIVPDPPQSSSCEENNQPCSDANKQQAATKFVGRMVRLSGDPAEILRRIPRLRTVMRLIDSILSFFGRNALVGGAHITLASKGIVPEIKRDFLFAGAGLNSSGAIFEGDVLFADEFTLESPKQLETSAMGRFLNGSDFEGGAKLTIKGNTNHTDLNITGNGVNKTVTFRGITCNSSSARSASGRLLPASGTDCDTIFMIPTINRNCADEEEDCPPSRKVESGRKFRVRTGRATYSSLPVIGKQFADNVGGCGATLGFINIGTDTGDNKWIYRKFLFIGKNNKCPFETDRGDFPLSVLIPRLLAIGNGDDFYAASNFIGPSLLNSAGNLNITNIPSVNFNLPGRYLPDKTTCANASADGITIPISAVECGEVPAPLHLTTPDPSDIDRCTDFSVANPWIAGEITKLRMGHYDGLINSVVSPPGLRYENYKDLFGKIGDVVRNGIFVGKTSSGEPIVTIVDFEVLSVHPNGMGGYVFRVRILSDPCSYDSSGTPVFLREEGCREGYIKNGESYEVFPVSPSHPPGGGNTGGPQIA